MQLSKLGRGLAVSAVSALMITGLAVTAPPALAADGDGVLFLSQQDAVASVRRDADAGGFSSTPSGTTVTLAAEQLDPGAAVSFQYNPDPTADDDSEGWTPVVGPTTNETPYRTVEWTPELALVGTSIALRAVATTSETEATPATTTYSTRQDVALSGDGSPVNAVTAGRGGPSSPFGPPTVTAGPYFVQPYADSARTASLLAVDGSTSATDGTVELSAWNATDGSFQGQMNATVEARPLKLPFNGSSLSFVDGGRFTGVLDISGFDAEDGDALALRAERDSDSVLPVRLSAQTITSISVEADLDHDGLVAGPENTAVPLSVRDQNGRPVVGAEVRRSSDGALVGYTDAVGQVTATQPNSTTESYYANTTDVDAFEDEVDVITDGVTTTDYVPVAEGIEAVLADGTVFDDQEYADGDIALQVVDGRGDPYPAAESEVSYSLHPTDHGPTESTTVTTDENGRVVLPFDPAGPDGEYTLAFTAPETSSGEDLETVTFVAGDAVLGLTPTAGTAASGGQITYAGSLSVEGAPLADRVIDLTYARGTEQAPGTEADAALLLRGERTLEGATTSGSDGSFAVTVDDLKEAGSPAETGGKLTVVARGLGDRLDATAAFAAPAPTVVTPVPTPTTPIPTPPVVPTEDAGKGRVELRLTGRNATRSDRLHVKGPASAAGERIRVHVLNARGHWRVIRKLRLDSDGDASLTVRDHNGNRVTRYRVRLLPNPRLFAFTSKVLRRR